VERGDAGLGRDAYGPPRRRRLGDRRAYRPGDGAGSSDSAGADDDEYGQLLRRPGDLPPQPGLYQPGLYQPGRSRMRPPPGRFPPPPGNPADGYPPNGTPGNGGPMNGGPMNGGPMNGGPMNGGPMNGGPMNGGPMNGGGANGGPMPGRQYRLPNGRRVPPRGDRPYRPYRPQAPGPAGDMRGPWDQPGPGQAPGPPGQDPPGGGWGRPPRPHAPGGPPPGSPPPGSPPLGSPPLGSPPLGSPPLGSPPLGGPPPRADGGPRAYSNPLGSPGMPGGPGTAGGSGFAGGPAGSRPEGREGWGRLGAHAPRGVPAGTAGPVIRQRENAVPEERAAPAQPAVSIAPDGLESFARDLRALRAKAELDYPELAEVSHYTMKTLVSAAGGLRLPTLPVAVAYVRACGGNVAEWEERWQKLAAKVTADAAKKRRGGGEERQALPEPADAPALPEPPAPPQAQDPPAESGEVYVITSAKPRQPGW
jgi:hypothetical protein